MKTSILTAFAFFLFFSSAEATTVKNIQGRVTNKTEFKITDLKVKISWVGCHMVGMFDRHCSQTSTLSDEVIVPLNNDGSFAIAKVGKNAGLFTHFDEESWNVDVILPSGDKFFSNSLASVSEQELRDTVKNIILVKVPAVHMTATDRNQKLISPTQFLAQKMQFCVSAFAAFKCFDITSNPLALASVGYMALAERQWDKVQLILFFSTPQKFWIDPSATLLKDVDWQAPELEHKAQLDL